VNSVSAGRAESAVKGETMFYRIQEGWVTLDGQWRDQSVNVLVPQDTSSKGANLVIARDSIPKGLTFTEYLQQQKKTFEKQLPDFKMHLDVVATADQRPMHNFEFTWNNEGKAMRQLMTVIGCGEEVLSLTATVPNGCEDASDILQAAMNSLTLDPRS
jgi:hypothetical protein